MTLHISDAQRRARLWWRHGFNPTDPTDPVTVTADLVALHATDPATVHLAVAARAPTAATSLTGALYEQRTLLRMLGMRRTMFVVPTTTAPTIHAAASLAIAAQQRRLLIKHLTQCRAGDADWLTDVETGTLAALVARGGAATAAQLAADEPRLRTRLNFPQGSQYLTSRVLLLLAAQGRIIRGRPTGTWTSSQYTWHTHDTWTPPLDVPDPTTARTALAHLWLARYGPGTLTDLTWWTGWSMTHTRAAVAALDTVPSPSTTTNPASSSPTTPTPSPPPTGGSRSYPPSTPP